MTGKRTGALHFSNSLLIKSGPQAFLLFQILRLSLNMQSEIDEIKAKIENKEQPSTITDIQQSDVETSQKNYQAGTKRNGKKDCKGG